ncbi:hypothetical protein ABZ816_15040 [Actinosynnema sp. NPDC047251]|uniref:hypothetical protein n=1 Tax=Saccharothrix espanaensis TaxID=103731 RepID=UPI00030C88AB|nr:hypothetical protein [Saccharothrix espanaensis]
MDESAIRIDSGLIDLTNVPLDVLHAFDERTLAGPVDRFLGQVDHPSNSVGSHNS